MKDLTRRVLMALWGIPLILLLSYLGGYYFLALILIINGMSLWEYHTIYHTKHYYAYRKMGVSLSTLLLLVTFFFTMELELIALGIVMVFLLLRHLKKSEPSSSVNTVFTISGIFYITFFLSLLLYLRMHVNTWIAPESVENIAGSYFIILWAAIWFCDTAAYFGGKFLGKHKLAPQTSPNKTIEGGISGLLGALLMFVILGYILVPALNPLYFWISGLIVGIFGQLGDLVESRFKRDAGVKDTSALLPGHGGFFDRFDSLIFVSPFIFILFYWVRI